MDARALAGDLKAALGMVLGIDHEMTETVGKRHEVAFRVEDGLLHPGGTLFQQPAQQMGFARARIALYQEARRQQFLEVQCSRGACRRVSHLDRNGHVPTQTLSLRRRAYQPDRSPSSTPWSVSHNCTTDAISTAASRACRHKLRGEDDGKPSQG